MGVNVILECISFLYVYNVSDYSDIIVPDPWGRVVTATSHEPDWKIGQWRPRFFSRYKFLHPWNRQFFMGKIFTPMNAHVFFVYTVHACTMASKIIE